MLELPAHLLEQIQSGNVVLFLGAGASLSAVNQEGKHPPSTPQLGHLIASKFLGGKFSDRPISQIADLAASESNLQSVQEFIKQVLEDFSPSSGHLCIPRIPWKGLATTNYDRMIENAYSQCTAKIQDVQPFIANGDRVDDRMRYPRSVMLLKLHGCITRTSQPECPLILTVDQYVTHRSGRSRLFSKLEEWGYEHSFIFIGHSLQDPDIRAILLELDKNPNKPRHFLVAPSSDPIEERFWGNKKISVISSTFDDFMGAIDSQLSPDLRGLVNVRPKVPHPIFEKFAQANAILTKNCQQFVEQDVEYVKGIQNTPTVNPKDFYKGYSGEWSPIEQRLDVSRRLADTVLSDNFLIAEADHAKGLEVVLIKAHAGGGKSVLLRRVAWDAAKEYDKICLYLKPSGVINAPALIELSKYCKERIFLFVDDLGSHIHEVRTFAKALDQTSASITLVGAERVNEWNVLANDTASFLTEVYELRYLQEREIEDLIDLLEAHQSLGTLDGKSREEKLSAFKERAGRQLLVSLHEATHGMPFEDIVTDEYNSIVPENAKSIYLTICILNRFNVSVRAGLISRLHGVHLTEFKKSFFRPLEHVVYTVADPISRDLAYTARHPLIADIVFHRVLTDQEERFEKFTSVLNALDIDYSSDRQAFRGMLRGKAIAELFPNLDMARSVFESAYQMAPHDAYVLHQDAIFHMIHSEFHEASDLLAEAARLRPNDTTILHSRSELLLKLAESARTDLEVEAYLTQATEIAKTVKKSRGDSHAHHTLIKIGLCRLKAVIGETEPDTVRLNDIVRAIEKDLSDGLQEFPNDSYLLSAEADFARILDQAKLMMDSLQKAFDSNPKAAFLAIRLANQLRGNGQMVESANILERALTASPHDCRLHFAYAKHLLQTKPTDGDTLDYHLRRSFISGDKSYDAQLLYGRQLYINGSLDESREVFRRLKNARASYENKVRLCYPLEGIFRGSVTRIEVTYIAIRVDGKNDIITAQRVAVSDDVWKVLTVGTRVRLRLEFNFHGPSASDLQVEGFF